MSHPSDKCPVTIVTGFLGSGKTTLLNAVLDEPAMRNTAVLVNEFGKIGLDHHLLRQIDEQTILIGGGCLCCNVRDDLVQALMDLLDKHQRGSIPGLDRVIIETSGLADPAPIVYTILTNPVLQHHYKIDLILVTVDAVNGYMQLDRQPESVKQIASADKIIITKTDISDDETVSRLACRIRTLNPYAQMMENISSELDLSQLFSHEGLENSQDKWQKQSTVTASNPLNSYSITNTIPHADDLHSISLTFAQPLDWTVFAIWFSMLLHARGEDLLRVKGIIDVGDEGPVVINGVQHIVHPPQHLATWPTADQRSHLVFIMRAIDPAEITTSLTAFQDVFGVRAAVSYGNEGELRTEDK